MANESLTIELTTDELNVILEGLGNLPFVRVFGLIGKIQAQATDQLGHMTGSTQSPPATDTD